MKKVYLLKRYHNGMNDSYQSAFYSTKKAADIVLKRLVEKDSIDLVKSYGKGNVRIQYNGGRPVAIEVQCFPIWKTEYWYVIKDYEVFSEVDVRKIEGNIKVGGENSG